MAAPTEVYVDPAIAADSGTGTVGDPYGDLKYAIVTLDNLQNKRINIKAGTDEVLTEHLGTTISGITSKPTLALPCIFQGYTTAAGDGGKGGISGGGSLGIYSQGTEDGIWFRDLHMHNCGSAAVLTFSGTAGWHGVVGCELDNTTGDGIIVGISHRGMQIIGCHFHNIGGDGVSLTNTNIENGVAILWNYFKNGTNDFVCAVDSVYPNCFLKGNIVSVDGTSHGFRFTGNGVLSPRIVGNSLLSTGTGNGIITNVTTTNMLNGLVANNLGEGFANGIVVDQTNRFSVFGANAWYNASTANFPGTTDHVLNLGDWNEALSASPFAKSGADTFANRFTYFSPVDTGNVHGGAYT